jgi:hypothetical protein
VPYFGAYAAIIESRRLEVRRIDLFKRKFVLGKQTASFVIERL